MKILVVGDGGREHVLAWSFDNAGHRVMLAGSNPGIEAFADRLDASAAPADAAALVAEAAGRGTDLVVVGPEAPLADGLVDRCRDAGLAAFGPTQAGARLEASKAYSKEIMARGSVPTAAAVVANDLDAGLAAVKAAGGPCVVKADGLAAGKGVVVADDQAEAEAAVRDCFGGRFGDAGSTVVVEERLVGPELSLLVLCDGKRVAPLPSAQDHKPIGEGDTGANTGGMGAYSPVSDIGVGTVDQILDTVVEPTLWALAKDGIDYRGVLYCGLMLTEDGPKVLEFNCRFGDPEAQAVIPRLDCDLGEVLAGAAAGSLDPEDVRVGDDAALCVVAAAEGYPATPCKGDEITGIVAANDLPGVFVFQAGTDVDATSGHLVTSGGRVLAVTGLGTDLATARDRAYAGIACIDWAGMYVRSDIGYRVFG